LFLLASVLAFLVATVVQRVKGPHALAIGMIRAPVVLLVIFVLGAQCILIRQHVVPLVLFMDRAWHTVLLAVVVGIGIFPIVGLLIFFLVSRFLHCKMDLGDFTSQHDNLLLVSVWTCPGSTLDHVCILALGHLHELIGGEVCSTIVNIVMMILDPHDEQFV